MKLSKFLSGLTALFLSTAISVSSLSISSYAINDESSEFVCLAPYEIEISLDEIDEEGFDVVLYYDDTIQSVSVYEGDFSNIPAEVADNSIGTFHLGLTFNMYVGHYNLYWQINLEQLTYMSAEVYCKDTAVFFPETFFEQSVTQRFDGSSSLGYGYTSYFDISSSYDTVKVGWKNCQLSSITDTYYIGNASQTVKLADLRP